MGKAKDSKKDRREKGAKKSTKKDKKGGKEKSKKDKDKGGKSKKGKKGRRDDSYSEEYSDDDSYTYSYSEYESYSASPSRSRGRGKDRRRGKSRGGGGKRRDRSRGRGNSRSRSRGRRGGGRGGRSRTPMGYQVHNSAGNRLLGGGGKGSGRRQLKELGNTGCGDHKKDLQEFIETNNLDDRTVGALEALSEEDQKYVMGTDGGENSFTLEGKVNNPNAVVMSRIRKTGR
eukprot:gnl/TRDRNA2_/TRDRNA2_185870_c0_seq1.p1 gnl/TRDRNA2_/TRDRNA2_185870_c0~~gnl/TRDRNA2_/TRDRNA2_185870_c0_seq1.p1  ORF type:complete len:261 (-),score=54.05 gnl/TRDRNA2_/TRDRNA2_185870_c0_seq1:87-776(-)